MKAKLIHYQVQKTYALVFDKEDEVISGLTKFAKDQALGASHFTAIGAFSDVTLGTLIAGKNPATRFRCTNKSKFVAYRRYRHRSKRT